MDQLTGFHAAQGILDDAIAALPDDPWGLRTACTDWTVADIVGHTTWGQDWLTSSIGGAPHPDQTGAPGSDAPADYLHGPPLTAWRDARERAATALTQDVLDQAPDDSSTQPSVGVIVSILEFDSLVHAWDLTRLHGIALTVPEPLIARVSETAHRVIQRKPGFFAAEASAPPDADPLTTLMAFCGRDVRIPA